MANEIQKKKDFKANLEKQFEDKNQHVKKLEQENANLIFGGESDQAKKQMKEKEITIQKEVIKRLQNQIEQLTQEIGRYEIDKIQHGAAAVDLGGLEIKEQLIDLEPKRRALQDHKNIQEKVVVEQQIQQDYLNNMKSRS